MWSVQRLLCVSRLHSDRIVKFYKLKVVKRGNSMPMIDDSNYCIFYYNDSYSTSGAGRSGTRIAYDYAKRVEKRKQSQLVVINIFPQ